MYFNEDLKELVVNSPMTSKEHFGAGMLVHNPYTNKILLAKRTDTNNYCNPGGRCEIGECVLDGVLRETIEEANVKVNSCKLYDYACTEGEGHDWVSFMFYTNDFDATDLANQEEEVGEWGWYDITEALNMDLFPCTRIAICRAIENELVYDNCKENRYIPFVECKKDGFIAHDTCHCAYSYRAQDEVFNPNNQGIYWD